MVERRNQKHYQIKKKAWNIYLQRKSDEAYEIYKITRKIVKEKVKIAKPRNGKSLGLRWKRIKEQTKSYFIEL